MFLPVFAQKETGDDMETERCAALVARARQNDNEAVKELIEETQNKFFFVARSYVKNEADAGDVLQNSYIKAFRTLNTLSEDDRFEAWFSRIVTNTALDYMRKNSTKYDLKFTDLNDAETEQEYDPADERIDYQPELSFSRQETERIINEIIASLPDEQRTAVMMHFFDGMTAKEIAEELGCKEVTVKARIRYAKEKIKDAVILIKKRDGIDLYGLAPIPFFLYLLKGFGGDACSAGTVSAAAASGSAAVHTAAVKTAGTAGAKSLIGKGIAGTVVKIAIAGAVVTGGVVTYNTVTAQNQSATPAAVETAKEATPSPTPAAHTQEEIYQSLISHGCTFTDYGTLDYIEDDDGNPIPEHELYMIENKEKKYTIYTYSGSNSKYNKGFSFQADQIWVIDRTAEKDLIRVGCRLNVSYPDHTILRDTVTDYVGVYTFAHGSGCVETELERTGSDEEILSEAQKSYEVMQDCLQELGITEDELYQFASTYHS